MTARDLRLTATLVDNISSGLAKISGNLEKMNVQAKAAADKNVADAERSEKARIQIMRNSVSLEDKLQSERVALAKAAADKIAQAEYQLARAEAGKTTERFERFREIENAHYKLRVLKAQENGRLLELEAERHAARMEAITAQEGAFAGTPFQKLLGHLGTLTGRKTNEVRESGEAALGLFGVEAEGPGMAAAGSMSVMGALGGPAMMAATVAAGALAVGMFEAVKAGKEMRESQEAVESSLKASGREETLGAAALEAYAHALAETTKFSDNQARAAEGMLLPFRNISDVEIPHLLKVSADLAAKMGIGLPEAAKTLGLAFDNPEKAARALREAGINLNAQEQKQIKSWIDMGESGKAHEFLFKRLQQALGDYATDTVHNTEIVGHQWEEMTGNIGVNALKIGDAIAGLILKYNKIQDANEEFHSGGSRFASYAQQHAHDFEVIGMAADKSAKLIEAYHAHINKISEEENKKRTGPATDTGEQITAQIKVQNEIEKARAASRQDGEQKAIAAEKERWNEQKALSLHGSTEDAQIETLHQVNLANIRDEWASKKADEQIKADQASARRLMAESKKEEEILRRQREDERRMISEEDKVRLDLKKRIDVAKKEAGRGNPNDDLKGAEQDDVAAFKLSAAGKIATAAQTEQMIEDIHEKYQRIREARDRAQAATEKQMSMDIVTNSIQAIQLLAGKNKALFLLQQSAAAAKVYFAGAEAVANDTAAPLGSMMWKVPLDIGVTAAQEAVIAAQTVNGFAGGTDSAPGGLSWVGERGPELMNVPRGAQIFPADESARMASGGGGVTHTGDVHINLTMPSGSSLQDGRKAGEMAAEGWMNFMAKVKRAQAEIPYRNVPEYNGF